MKLLLPFTIAAGIAAGVSAFLANAAPAPQPPQDLSSAAGLWEQYNDDDGRREGWFLIFEKSRGVYDGAIVKMFLKPGEDPYALRCTKCTGEQKNQPSLGLVIIKGMQRQGKSYENGTILDPRDGQIWSARMELGPDGKQLEVRGFLGVSLFGRSQIWKRLPDNALPPNEVPPNVVQYMPLGAKAAQGAAPASTPHQAQQTTTTAPRPSGQQPSMQGSGQGQNPNYQQQQQRRFQ
ncbi:MAG: DUF2147 domain-containing protein [Pseudomonadota bacterium]